MDVFLGALGVLFVILGWGLGDFLGARLSRKLGEISTYFILTLLLAVITAPFALAELDVELLTVDALLPVVGIAAFEFLAGFLFFAAMRRGKTSIVEPVSALSIGFTAVFAYFLLGEQIPPLGWALLGVSLLGGVLVSLEKTKAISIHDLIAPGAFLALLSAVVYGGLDYASKLAVGTLGPVVSLFLATLLSAVIALILIVLVEKQNPLNSFTKESLSAGIIGGLGWIGYVFALDNLDLSVAAGMINAFPVVTMIAAHQWDGEHISTTQKVGALLLIASAVGLGLVAGISK